MSSRPAKAVRPVGGALTVAGIIAAALSGDLWLAAIFFGFLLILAVIAGRILFRRPYFEFSETMQDGTRRRLWRAGVEHSPHNTSIVTPSSSELPGSESVSDHFPRALPSDGSGSQTTRERD